MVEVLNEQLQYMPEEPGIETYIGDEIGTVYIIDSEKLIDISFTINSVIKTFDDIKMFVEHSFIGHDDYQIIIGEPNIMLDNNIWYVYHSDYDEDNNRVYKKIYDITNKKLLCEVSDKEKYELLKLLKNLLGGES